MPARAATYTASATSHVISLEQDAATGGPLTNSGARTVGGLENLPGQTGNTFTMTEVIKIKETVNAPIPPSGTPVSGTFDGLETAAGPSIQVKNIQIPSSYKGDTLSFSHPKESDKNPSNFIICPDIKITCTLGPDSSTGGQGSQEVTAVITGPVKEMDDWVLPWNDPVAGIPKFNGSDFATTKSAGYGRENGVFTITFDLVYGALDSGWDTGTSPIPEQTKSWSISIINNADNDRDVYIQKYNEAYGALTKVPELDERQ